MEAVSYGWDGWDGFDEIWSTAEYYRHYWFHVYSEHYCQDTWRCVTGRWEIAYPSEFQIWGDHWFQHGQGWYGIGNTWSDGECFPPEAGGC